MRAQDFNAGWLCRHLEEAGPGLPVTLPDDAMLREKRSAAAMGGAAVGWFEGRDYSYTKTFFLSEAQLRGSLVLEFEGVYRKAEVRLNGQKTAFRPYGYTNFYVDCKPFVRAGERGTAIASVSDGSLSASAAVTIL